MIKVLFFFENAWAFGSIHNALAKELYPYGIHADIIDWASRYVLEEFDLLPFSNTLNILHALNEAGKKDVVIQAPFAIQKYRHILFAAPDAHFVGMVRPRDEILESMRRIEWCKNDFDNWEEYIEQHVDKMIALWDQLKDEVSPSNWTELHYEDLKDHPFFVDKKLIEGDLDTQVSFLIFKHNTKSPNSRKHKSLQI